MRSSSEKSLFCVLFYFKLGIRVGGTLSAEHVNDDLLQAEVEADAWLRRRNLEAKSSTVTSVNL